MEVLDKTVFVPVDYDFLANKKVKVRCFLNMVDNSVYYPEEDKRIFSKDQVNYTKIGKILKMDRRTVKSSIDEMIKEFPQIVEQRENGDIVIYNNRQDGQYVISTLSHRMVKDLYTCFNDNVIKLYFYLYRQYTYWTQVRKAEGFDFTITQLCKALGLNPTSNHNRDNIRNWLGQLVLNKMICYAAVEKQTNYGKVLYYRLLNICDYVPVNLIIEEQTKQIQEKYIESNDVPSADEGEGVDKIVHVWGSVKEELKALPEEKEELSLPGYEVPSLAYEEDFVF